ncbi:MAG: L-ribulose-5-phosphate 3-epimerase [Planctomycetota bacterium]
MANRIGVCSWSLQPQSAAQLAERVSSVGLKRVQLALDLLRSNEWAKAEALESLASNGIEVISGMMQTRGEDYSSLESIQITGGLRPDKHWNANRKAATENARLAREIGITLVSFHAGFLPEDSDSPDFAKMIVRLQEVIDRFADVGVQIAFETGQESAETLDQILYELDRPNAGVNFDPANMILYNMGEPVAALEQLIPWVRQIHVKDATRTSMPGTWGSEVPVGTGEVDWQSFFALVKSAKLDCDLVIEREDGNERERDIAGARDLIRKYLPEAEL